MVQPRADGLDDRAAAPGQSEKRLLRDVLSQRRVPRDSLRRRMNHSRVGLDQRLKRLRIAVAMIARQEMEVCLHSKNAAQEKPLTVNATARREFMQKSSRAPKTRQTTAFRASDLFAYLLGSTLSFPCSTAHTAIGTERNGTPAVGVSKARRPHSPVLSGRSLKT